MQIRSSEELSEEFHNQNSHSDYCERYSGWQYPGLPQFVWVVLATIGQYQQSGKNFGLALVPLSNIWHVRIPWPRRKLQQWRMLALSNRIQHPSVLQTESLKHSLMFHCLCVSMIGHKWSQISIAVIRFQNHATPLEWCWWLLKCATDCMSITVSIFYGSYMSPC